MYFNNPGFCPDHISQIMQAAVFIGGYIYIYMLAISFDNIFSVNVYIIQISNMFISVLYSVD